MAKIIQPPPQMQSIPVSDTQKAIQIVRDNQDAIIRYLDVIRQQIGKALP